MIAHVAGLLTLVAGQDPAPLDVGELLRSRPEQFGAILERAAEHRLQVLVADVVERDGHPTLRRDHFRAGPEYFYPASSIKTSAAIAAVEYLNAINLRDRQRFTLHSPLRIHPLFEDEELEENDPSNLDGGTITIGHEIRKLFLVSDNRAYNRLYELVGHAGINGSVESMGLESARIYHRLSELRSPEDQRRTPRIEILRGERDPFVSPERTSDLVRTNDDLSGILVGEAHVAGDEKVEGPFSFREKNYISLVDLQDQLALLVRPDVELEGKRDLLITDDQRAFLLEAMSQDALDSKNPVYDPERYQRGWVKYLLPGLSRVVPAERLKIYNKVGRAYGFSVENAYVVDQGTGRSFFLAAVIYTNPNGVVNDGEYAYEAVADPFFADLGEAVARALWD